MIVKVVSTTLMTTWGKKGRRSVLRKLFLRYYMYFPSALSSFSEATLKRLPTAIEAEVKQVISAQLKYASDRTHGGGHRNDGRAIERSGKRSGTSNSQLSERLRENFYRIYHGL